VLLLGAHRCHGCPGCKTSLGAERPLPACIGLGAAPPIPGTDSSFRYEDLPPSRRLSAQASACRTAVRRCLHARNGARSNIALHAHNWTNVFAPVSSSFTTYPLFCAFYANLQTLRSTVKFTPSNSSHPSPINGIGFDPWRTSAICARATSGGFRRQLSRSSCRSPGRPFHPWTRCRACCRSGGAGRGRRSGTRSPRGPTSVTGSTYGAPPAGT